MYKGAFGNAANGYVETHNGAISQFNFLFIHSGNTVFTKTDYQKIAKADRIRNASDYDDFYLVNKEETKELLEFVKDFMIKTEEYIELTGVERDAARRLGPDRQRVIRIVGREAAVFDLLHREVFGELVHDGSHHLKVREFLRADVGIEIVHLKSSIKWAHHRKY